MSKNRSPVWTRSPSRMFRKHRLPTRPNVLLYLESLESRTVPAVAANDVYVSSLYQGLLGRDADPAGLAYWTAQLNAGQTRAAVALGIETSDEAIGRAVQIYYEDFLGRPGDSVGVNYWVNEVRQGSSLEQVKAGILGSTEFLTDHGGTVGSFLNAVYQAELGRSIDPAGLSYWTALTANTTAGRADTALQIMQSTEGERDKIVSIYEAVLGRDPDPTGGAYWFDAIRHGVGDVDVIAGIVGSDEYFATIQQFAAAATDANAAAHQFIVTEHRFSGKLPGAEQLDSNITTDPSLVLPPSSPAANTAQSTGQATGNENAGQRHQKVVVVFVPGLANTENFFSSGPVVTNGPVASAGPTGAAGPSGGFTGGGFTGGGGGTGGGGTGGGGTGGGGTGGGGTGGGGTGGGGTGGVSGSLRAAPDHGGGRHGGGHHGGGHHGAHHGGMRGVGGRGVGSGAYLGHGLLNLNGVTLPGGSAQFADPIGPPLLTEQQLLATVTMALDQLELAGVDPAVIAKLSSATYEVGQLPGNLLGYTFASDNTVVIDPNAAGYGWFVDPTAQSDMAFVNGANGTQTAAPGSPASGHMDLLTAVLHEMGHLDGLPDLSTRRYPNNLMDGTLTTGTRRTDALDTVFAAGFYGHAP
jgi:Domain of unknown function (DUF4214)